ncbi:MAG TPA: RNA 2',3'-cyclic phosphodiesterase [Pyrinomonadaceae bacterium]|jgi:2'-5' RNA ligase|nr:RNA 2',3'-cyclic phosphodiesterase [Pyrinomonadaceae bacterium]
MPDETPKPLRVFCSVELPDELRSRVAERARRLRTDFPDVRASWEKPEKLHLTLKFLGDVEPARVEALSSAAARAAANREPFELIIEEPGTFPPHGQPRVLWLGIVDASGSLALMQRALETECAAVGFPRESRDFRPHLTLARIRSPQGARELAAAHRETPFEPQRFKVSELVVMRSELGPGGSRYTPLSRRRLGNVS